MTLSILLRTGAVVAAVTLSATACGDDQNGNDEAVPSPGSPSSEAPAGDRGVCDLLSEQTVEELFGEAVSGEPTEDYSSGVTSCVYGDPPNAVIFGQRPADEWARSLPDIVEQLRAAPGVPEDALRRIDEGAHLVEQGKTIPPDQACGLYGEMIALQTNKPNAIAMVAYYPSQAAPEAVNATNCSEGTYRWISVMRPGLDATAERNKLMLEAMKKLIAKTSAGPREGRS